MTPISSPCVRVCRIDQATQLCDGCGRTVNEIRGWRLMDEDERLAVMSTLEDRMKKAAETGCRPYQDMERV